MAFHTLPPARRRAPRIAGAFLVTALGTAVLGGCSGVDDAEGGGGEPTTAADPDIRPSGDLEDPYDGAYTAEFREDLDAYTNVEVTLTGEVVSIVSPVAFTMSGPDGADVEPILVLTSTEPALAPGDQVVVAAQPEDEFSLAEAEDALGADLPDEAFEEWEDEPYLAASQVRTES
ncbi:hypothetical protein ABC795_10170 [Blastococcus sp. HT6-30]|uniref:hypothetical protein n=1 Tax=Blastococcus sp. HT6-30 TaxID=3144843 RepID=UPI00321B1DD6